MSYKLTIVFGLTVCCLMSGMQMQAMDNNKEFNEKNKKINQDNNGVFSLGILPVKNLKTKLTKEKQEWLNNQLFEAASNDNKDAAENVINQGASIDVQMLASPNTGMTPLHFACAHNSKNVAKLLVLKGANINTTDVAEWTPLHWACIRNSVKTAKFIIRNSVNIDMIDVTARTPLSWTCANGYLEIAKLLIEHGAGTITKNTYGHTVLDDLKKWPPEKLNKLCQALAPLKQGKFETQAQLKTRIYAEVIIATLAEQLQQGILPLVIPAPKVKNVKNAPTVENPEELIALVEKIFSYFFLGRIKPLVSTSTPNRELSEKQYHLALELFDCHKSAVLKVLTDHKELRVFFKNLLKALKNSKQKIQKNYCDMIIHFKDPKYDWSDGDNEATVTIK